MPLPNSQSVVIVVLIATTTIVEFAYAQGFASGSKASKTVSMPDPGYVLRVSGVEYHPILFVIKNDDGTVSYEGFEIDIFDYIAKSLRITYSIVRLNQTEVIAYGPLPAGVRAFLRDEVDVVGTGIIMHSVRSNVMKIAVPVLISEFNFVVPWPEEKHYLLAYMQPFQFTVWICLAICTFVVPCALHLLSKSYRHFSNGSSTATDVMTYSNRYDNQVFSDYLVYVLSILTLQGNRAPTKRMTYRFVAGIWGLGALIIAYAYSGTFFAYLTVPQMNPIVQSFEQLATSDKFKPMVEFNSIIANNLLTAESGYRKIIGDKLRSDPVSVIMNVNDRLKHLTSGPYVYPVISPFFSYYLVKEAYKLAGNKCTHTVARQPLSLLHPIVYPFAKNFPYLDAVDKAFLAAFETGLTRYWSKKYRPRIDQCVLENHNVGLFGIRLKNELSLKKLSGAFILLGVGTVLALCVFILENLVFWKTLRIKTT